MRSPWPTVLVNRTVKPVCSAVPGYVAIAITSRCQLRCTHCFNSSGHGRVQELSLEQIERVLDEVVTWGLARIRLSGGEPSLHPQFPEVVRACRERGLSVVLNTNGHYSKATLDHLRSAPVELFIVSIDGLADHNDEIRGPGSFARAVEACQALVGAGQRVMISCHVGASAVGDVAGLIDLAEEIGCDLKVSPIRPVGRARRSSVDLTVGPEAYRRVVERVAERRPDLRRIKVFTDFDILGLREGSEYSGDLDRASCKAGRTMLNINYDGRIYPCAFFITPGGEFSAGTIDEGTLESAWRSASFDPFRVQTKCSECQDCPHYKVRCVGGCPAISHFTNGVLDGLDPVCFAKLIRKGEPGEDG